MDEQKQSAAGFLVHHRAVEASSGMVCVRKYVAQHKKGYLLFAHALLCGNVAVILVLPQKTWATLGSFAQKLQFCTEFWQSLRGLGYNSKSQKRKNRTTITKLNAMTKKLATLVAMLACCVFGALAQRVATTPVTADGRLYVAHEIGPHSRYRWCLGVL